MTAGDEGVGIVLNFGGYNATGNTVTLLAAPGAPGRTGTALSLTPVMISNGGLIGGVTYPIVTGGYGIYVTTGEDIQEGGAWQLQSQVVTTEGQTYTSPPAPIFVYPRL